MSCVLGGRGSIGLTAPYTQTLQKKNVCIYDLSSLLQSWRHAACESIEEASEFISSFVREQMLKKRNEKASGKKCVWACIVCQSVDRPSKQTDSYSIGLSFRDVTVTSEVLPIELKARWNSLETVVSLLALLWRKQHTHKHKRAIFM